MSTIATVGVVLTAVVTIVGCALLWHQANGLTTSRYDTRAYTAGVFDYIYLLFFAILALAGRIKKQLGITRIGLLGMASLILLVHTGFNGNDAESWANANRYRQALNDEQSFEDTRADKDSNREMLGGMALCYIGTIIALITCGFGTEDKKAPSKGSLFSFVLATAGIVALCIVWWDSKLTTAVRDADSNDNDDAVYENSLFIISSAILLVVILATGLFLDVPEYVGVVAFFASAHFANTLQNGFAILTLLPGTSVATEDERKTARAGTAIFYFSMLLLMISAALYFAEKFTDAKERTAGVINYLLIIASLVCLVPGVALLWHQAEGLGAGTSDDKNSIVADAFSYVYIVVLGLGGIIASKSGKHGMVPFFMIGAAGMLFTESVDLNQFSWANGNVFRKSDMDNTVNAYYTYQAKSTFTDDDSNRQVAGGFVLCQIASFLAMAALVTLSAGERQRNAIVLAMSVITIMAFVACGVFEAQSKDATVPVTTITANYYVVLHMVAVFFFLTFFVLVGFIVGATEYSWVCIIIASTYGLQLLAKGFTMAALVDGTAGNQKDRHLTAGALGFIFSVVIVLASSIAGFVSGGDSAPGDDYFTIGGK